MKYEVQFRDGFNIWRQWSIHNARGRAEKSLARLQAHFGAQLVGLGYTRIVERP